jgi:hypothetical protein
VGEASENSCYEATTKRGEGRDVKRQSIRFSAPVEMQLSVAMNAESNQVCLGVIAQLAA